MGKYQVIPRKYFLYLFYVEEAASFEFYEICDIEMKLVWLLKTETSQSKEIATSLLNRNR